MLHIVKELKPQYGRANRLYKLIFKVNRILSQDATAEKVEASMLVFFDNLAELFGHSKLKVEREAFGNILRYTAGYWEGLFYQYGHEDIPRTNNELEVYIRSLKMRTAKYLEIMISVKHLRNVP